MRGPAGEATLPAPGREPTAERAQQGSRAVIVTALIGAVTTLGAAFMNRPVPAKPDPHEATIRKLETELAAVTQQLRGPGPHSRISITGSVLKGTGSGEPMGPAQVYLVPFQNNDFVRATDDAGRFSFANVPSGVYSFLIRDQQSRALLGSMEEGNREGIINVQRAVIKYRVTGD